LGDGGQILTFDKGQYVCRSGALYRQASGERQLLFPLTTIIFPDSRDKGGSAALFI